VRRSVVEGGGERRAKGRKGGDKEIRRKKRGRIGKVREGQKGGKRRSGDRGRQGSRQDWTRLTSLYKGRGISRGKRKKGG